MRYVHLLIALALAVSAVAGKPARAAEQAMPIPGHTVLFGCHVRDGKTMEDVWSLLEEFARIVPPRDDRSAFLWLPLHESSGLHLRWGVNYPSLTAYADARTAFESSPAWAPWANRHGETLQCTSSLLESREVRAGVLGGTVDRQPDAMAEFFQCDFREGMKQADLEEGARHMAGGDGKDPVRCGENLFRLGLRPLHRGTLRLCLARRLSGPADLG